MEDTNTQNKIRFLEIDAPEKAQTYGQKSKHNLSDLIFGRQVTF
ncbi:MAG: thermonuclease family protein [Acidobacteriota bacterium]|nr:thermonuclease family protein [Acidobacteriota bacterium]